MPIARARRRIVELLGRRGFRERKAEVGEWRADAGTDMGQSRERYRASHMVGCKLEKQVKLK